ncbi:MAG: hypothetical protein WAQ27_00455 [Candidatus Microsaccharimonas sp.]
MTKSTNFIDHSPAPSTTSLEGEQLPVPVQHNAAELAHTAIKGLVQPKNLELLRFGVRGNDEAVQEIGTEAQQQQLAEILAHPGSHTRDELLNATFANYSGDVYGDKQWIKKRSAWGDAPEVITAYGHLMDAHPEWAQLSLDPGFMTHLPTFMDLLDKGEITATTYQEVREQFKDKLGNKTVWRGTMLTDEEFAKVQSEGLSSPLSRVVKVSDQPKDQFEASALSAWPAYTVEKHFHGEHWASPLLSVSDYPNVAISVGRHFGDKAADKKFYLLKLDIPVIDLISYTDHAYKTPSMLRQLQDRNADFTINVAVNDEETSHKWDESVESFVSWKIDAAEILEITQPNINQSSWNGRVTGPLKRKS